MPELGKAFNAVFVARICSGDSITGVAATILSASPIFAFGAAARIARAAIPCASKTLCVSCASR